MDVKKLKKKSSSSDPYKNPALADFPSAYRIARHFETHNAINETAAFLLYGELAVASKIDVLESMGYKFKYRRKRLGFRNISREWTIIRD